MSDRIVLSRPLAAVLGSALFFGLLFCIYLFLAGPLLWGALALVLIVLYTGAIAFGARKFNLTDGHLKLLTFLQITFFMIVLSFGYFSFMYLAIAIAAVGVVLVYRGVFRFRDFVKLLFIFVVVFIMATTLFEPAVAMSRGQGTVLSDNWFNALNWLEANTPECAVVATYWDPGHFITGIAHRPVVFDGASQNSLWNITVDPDVTSDELAALSVTGKYRATNVTLDGVSKTRLETARIQDISTSLATDDEALAVRVMEKFRKPGCPEMYYLATADLIGKSYWWTYFWSWNPVDKGCATPMSTLGLRQQRPSVQGGITYVYEGGIPMGCNQQGAGQVVVLEQNNTLAAFVLAGNQLQPVEHFFYFTPEGGILRQRDDAPVKGMVILDPSRQAVIFVPPEIQNSMFNRMFFFNGQGLERFEYVNSWGGEVKLFRLRFNDTNTLVSQP